MRILNVTADYPDAHSMSKTNAVRNLIEGTSIFTHCIYSINRCNGLGGIQLVNRNGNLTTLTYRAPPYGILLETFLNSVAEWIINDSRRHSKAVDLVHAHKLTIEGLIARRVAQLLSCPYICSVQGNTDQKYLRFKPEKHWVYREIAENAAILFFATPWIEYFLARRLSLTRAPRRVLPIITKSDRFLMPKRKCQNFVTVFHLDDWRNKGMMRLLSAINKLKAENIIISLDIIGGGSDCAIKSLKQAIHSRGVGDQVKLLGAIPHEQIQDVLNGYAGLVLPSLRETFGMVYIEALFSGVPILYSKNRGIDGFFNDQVIGVRCDPKSVSSIVKGLLELKFNSERMKQNIYRMQQNGSFERFRKDTICRDYIAAVKSLITMQ